MHASSPKLSELKQNGGPLNVYLYGYAHAAIRFFA